MKYRSIVVCVSLLAGFTYASAQISKNDSTLNRTVVVEREYNPIIKGTTKVNVLPKVEEPNITPKKVEYDLAAMQPKSYSVALVSPLVATETEVLPKVGYLRFGFGNNGNLDARAHYTYLISPKDKLTFDFTSYGLNGKLNGFNSQFGKWDSFYYRTFGSLAYEHKFDAAILKFNGGYKVNNFNFLSIENMVVPGLEDLDIANKQRFNTGNFGVGVKSTDEDLFIKYDVSSEFMIYQRQFDLLNSNLKESSLNTTAKLITNLDEDNAIGLDINMYNRVVSTSETKNSTTLDLNPYYGLSLANWKFRLGANIDLGFGFGESILISPDLMAELNIAQDYVLYAKATGGRMKSNFSSMEVLSPYTLISANTRDVYEHLNAGIGFKGSPVTGLWFNVYGGFQKLKDDLYTEVMDYSMPISTFANTDTKNGYLGAMMKYKYKKIFDFSVSGVYRNWSSKKRISDAMMFKPKFEFDVDMSTMPINGLLVGLHYNYVTRSDKYAESTTTVGKINKLGVYGTYEFVKNLSVYAKLDNIFNKKYQYSYGYPIEGTNFVAGLSFKF